MPAPNMNVFSGDNALFDFYDPEKNPPLPLVEIPKHPFRKDGVRIYAKLMSCLPAGNVKALPALNMLLRGKEEGKVNDNTHTIIEYSSGSTVISLALIAHIMGIENVKAYISNKTSPAKLDLLRFFGLDLTLFAGHGQPEPLDPNGGIYNAVADGSLPGNFNPDQYANPQNWQSHERWTGPQIIAQLPEIQVFAASIGTSGTMTGSGLYLKKAKPSITRVGVCTAPDDRVPGPRSYSLLEPVDWFPWREAIDALEEIGSYESFECSLDLCRQGLLVGPSSGLALLGVYKFLQKRKDAGTIDALRNEDGEIPCAFICCDAPTQYIKEYYEKLGESHFLPIRNSELIGVDPYAYSVDWELTSEEAHNLIFLFRKPVAITTESQKKKISADKQTIVLDLRDAADASSLSLPSSLYLPLPTPSKDAANPYQHPPTMVTQFRFLDGRLGSKDDQEFGGKALEGKVVLTLSYDGNTARVAMSVLRNRGIEACCIMGGVEAWKKAKLYPFDK